MYLVIKLPTPLALPLRSGLSFLQFISHSHLLLTVQWDFSKQSSMQRKNYNTWQIRIFSRMQSLSITLLHRHDSIKKSSWQFQNVSLSSLLDWLAPLAQDKVSIKLCELIKKENFIILVRFKPKLFIIICISTTYLGRNDNVDHPTFLSNLQGFL